ncbi:sigma-E factor negative regulatory protein [Microbulbifer bruguierae]|uniref:Sigma-E factor negative regulatory protein n=1 Tax=Microbulbifer bruguierae TaxID=3029061 RepID=A0ABY8NDM0_9GAMM|nr:sigma-E factor negative regulatory protein [Microbulbifer bruguierae]WGL16707.1 sigma-E factor negative regulatory protein [Microbulbifer bruguierae]
MSHGNHQQRLHESLSALMDGEANELELQRLLKESEVNGGVSAEDLNQRWSRYQLAASVMRGEKVAPVDLGLAASISAAIADEPPLSQPAEPQSANDGGDSSGGNRWLKSLSRGAVAATVAFAAILGVQQMQAPQPGTELVAEVERPVQQPVQPMPQSSGFVTPALNTRAVSTAPQLVPEPRVGVSPAYQGQVVPSPELMRHLNRVMLEHSEQAARVGSQGMVPFARATYGERPAE